MKELSESLVGFLKDEDWRFEELDGEKTYRLHFDGRHGSYSMMIFIDNERRMFNVCTKCPIDVPKSKLTAIAELISRINCNLTLGNFDLDIDDGLIFFKTGMKAGKANPEHETISTVIFGNCYIIDRYLPTLASVIYGRLSPKKAIQLFWDSKDEYTQEYEEDSFEDEPPSNKRFSGRMGFFSDN